MTTGSEADMSSSMEGLRAGCRVELTGLSSEDLNGQRGGISYIADRGRWPVVVDGTGRKLSCKSTNLKELASGHCDRGEMSRRAEEVRQVPCRALL